MSSIGYSSALSKSIAKIKYTTGEPHQFFPDIRFIRKLGKGTGGRVSKFGLQNGKVVAVKDMKPCYDGVCSNAMIEINSLQQLKGCANIIQLIDLSVILESGITLISLILPYYTNDLVKFCKRTPTLGRIKCADVIINQLLNGLLQIHSHGILHGNIKPDNVMVEYGRSKGEIKCYIADFGNSIQMSRDLDTQLPIGMINYTFMYRAPEIYNGGRGFGLSADIWALGATLVEYFTGRYLLPLDLDIMNNEVIDHRLLTILSEPLPVTKENIDLLVSGDIYDYVDVDLILSNNLPQFEKEMIPVRTIKRMEMMLEVFPSDRPTIVELIGGEVHHSTRCVQRRQIKGDEVNTEMFYILVGWLFDVGKKYQLSGRTAIMAVDMVTRFVGSYATNITNLQLYGCTCLLLASKISTDRLGIEVSDAVFICDDAYSKHEVKQAEITILKTLNYIITSLEADQFIHVVTTEFPTDMKQLDALKSIYKQAEDDGIDPNTVTYDRLIRYIM